MTFIKSNAVLAVTQEDKTLQSISSETYIFIPNTNLKDYLRTREGKNIVILFTLKNVDKK